MRWVLLLVALLLPLGHARAAAGSEGGDAFARFTHEDAVEAYHAGDLQTARVLWEELLAHPDLHDDDRALVAYGLGNVAFREDRFVEAATRYHAAIELRPRFADAWHNLELARSRAGLEAADRGDLAATAERLLAAPTSSELAATAWFGVAFLALGLLWEIRRGGLLPRLVAGASLLLVLAALGLDTWRQVTALEAPALVQAGASLRSEPDPSLPVLTGLSAGDRVELLERHAGWARVRSGEHTGWVRGDEVLELLPR